jgi:hypothetical protein
MKLFKATAVLVLLYMVMPYCIKADDDSDRLFHEILTISLSYPWSRMMNEQELCDLLDSIKNQNNLRITVKAYRYDTNIVIRYPGRLKDKLNKELKEYCNKVGLSYLKDTDDYFENYSSLRKKLNMPYNVQELEGKHITIEVVDNGLFSGIAVTVPRTREQYINSEISAVYYPR